MTWAQCPVESDLQPLIGKMFRLAHYRRVLRRTNGLEPNRTRVLSPKGVSNTLCKKKFFYTYTAHVGLGRRDGFVDGLVMTPRQETNKTKIENAHVRRPPHVCKTITGKTVVLNTRGISYRFVPSCLGRC